MHQIYFRTPLFGPLFPSHRTNHAEITILLMKYATANKTIVPRANAIPI